MAAQSSETKLREAIYFDGHLPLSKRTVRFTRTAKSTSQLMRFVKTTARGIPVLSNTPSVLTRSQLFQVIGNPGAPQPPSPSFHVPCVIDALRRSIYKDVVHMVPGEADDFCASHVFQANQDCSILTSDSDLLVHDFPQGSVVFMRDIYLDSEARLACAIFAPTDVNAQLGFKSIRLAYERERSPHATSNQLRRTCLSEVEDELGYRTFCRRYEHGETAVQALGWNTQGLDPRLSELLYQFVERDPNPHMFMPFLVEDPAKRSSWEPSSALRTMAYTFLAQAFPYPAKSLREYRKVLDLAQHKGTEVKLSSRRSRIALEEFSTLIKMCSPERLPESGTPCWLVLCLAISIQQDYCKSERKSHVLEMLRKPVLSKHGDKVTWDEARFTVDIHATLYSLRLLSQVLCSLPKGALSSLPHELETLSISLVKTVPALTEFPSNETIASLLRDQERRRNLLATLGKILGTPELNHTADSATPKRVNEAEDDIETKRVRQAAVDEWVSKKKKNPFELLLADDES